MASQRPPPTRLDAFNGREVVFCYECNNEWYKDESGVICPACASEFVMIVTAEEDPRPPLGSPDSDEDLPRLHRHGGDSDPEEADIDDHVLYGPRFVLHRTTFTNPPTPGNPRPPGPEPGQPDVRHPLNPGDGEETLGRFLDMLGGFGFPVGSGEPRAGAPGGWQPPSNPGPFFNSGPPRAPGSFFGGGSGGFHRTTIRTGPGGVTSFTIASSGPIHLGPPGADHPGGPGDFPSVFGSILNEAGPPGFAHGQTGGDRGAQPPPGTFAASLHEILNLLNPANATMGDAVYSQEALDRIITALMEQNPQSNAAPPATEAALGRLDRKKVDEKMLQPEGRVECTICIDEMKEGDEVIVLPCKHWFHDQCVVMWLKEHNTCPICRSPIEANASRNNNAASAGGGDGNNDPSQPPSAGGGNPPQPGAHGHDGPFMPAPPFPPMSFGNMAFDSARSSPGTNFNRRDRYFRTSSSTPTNTRLSDVIRNLSGPPEADHGSQGDRRYNPPSFDTSRFQPPRPRRTSMSPTSPGAHGPSEQASRVRRRSPSPGHQHHHRRPFLGSQDRDRDGSRNDSSSGHSRGPLGWLRDQLNGSGSQRRRS